ncbi:MAG: signal recognition particle-docking protein FtsY [Desulfopila sp.]
MLGWFTKKKKHVPKTDSADSAVPADLPESSAEAGTTSETTPNVRRSEAHGSKESSEPALQGSGLFPESAEAAPASKRQHPPVTDQPSTGPKPQEPGSSSLFKRLSDKLSRTRDTFVHQMDSLFLGKKVVDAELLDDLEELLITADIGVATATELLDHARRQVKRKELSDPAALKMLIRDKLRSYIADTTEPAEIVMPDSGPFVIMVVGVNGVGKTTTIGKIAHKFLNSGQTVLLAAGDTFRAAAVSQLRIWGERSGIEVVDKGKGADPSSVAFDALTRAVAEDYDVVIVDTAGRLHTQKNLMEELKKIKRVMGKKLEGAPHEILLVLDATTGQNGLSQAKLFDEAVGITGLALTKLDGTAKGGIVANLSRDMKIPIRFIGIGEKLEDLRDFNADEFIEALFRENN